MGIYLFPALIPTQGRKLSHDRQAIISSVPDTADDSATGRSCELDLFWLLVIIATLLPALATGKGLFGPCAKLYFLHNPIAETGGAILAGDGVGTARTGHAGVWPSTGSTESRRPRDCSLTALMGPIAQSWQIPTQLGSGPVMSPQRHADSPHAVIPAFKNSWY